MTDKTTQDVADAYVLGPTVHASPALARALLGLPPELTQDKPDNYTDVYVTIDGGRVLLTETDFRGAA